LHPLPWQGPVHGCSNLKVDILLCPEATWLQTLTVKPQSHGTAFVQDVPPVLGTLTKLTSFSMRGNPLRQPLARIAEARDDMALLAFVHDRAERCDVAACGFEALPAEVCDWPRSVLCELDLNNNRLVDLPQVCGACSTLLGIGDDSFLLVHRMI
jgi:hypothetical protein